MAVWGFSKILGGICLRCEKIQRTERLQLQTIKSAQSFWKHGVFSLSNVNNVQLQTSSSWKVFECLLFWQKIISLT